MTARKIRSSTNQEQAARDGEALDRAIEALAEGGDDVNVAPLSDLSRGAQARLRSAWPMLSPAVRLAAIRAMVDDSEQSVERDFTRALLVATEDLDPDIRLLAWDGLWEDDSAERLQSILDRIATEPDDRVRAAMAEALATWSALGELGELGENDAAAVRGTLLGLVRRDVSMTVRQRALESAGHISGDVEIIREIQDAAALDDDAWQISALRAMGRQSDIRWREQIGRGLSHPEPELRYEAVRAAGDSADQVFLSALIDLIDDDDNEVRLATIASIGAIGGTMAVRTLRRLLQAEDAVIADAALDALDEALLTTGQLPSGPLLDPRSTSDTP